MTIYTIELAVEQLQTGNVQQAEAICREILKYQPDNAEVLHLLGIICYEAKNYDAALQYIAKTLKSDPANASAYYYLGNVLKSKRLFNEAISSYQNAIQITSHFPEAYNNIGIILLENRQPHEAINYFMHALQLNPNLADIHCNLGTALQASGRFDEAISCYKNALSLNPNLNDAFYSLVCVYKEKNKRDDAITNKNIIHCIGDSHACFFSGKDEIHPSWPFHIGENFPLKSYRIGAALAYNLCLINTTTRGRENLFLILETLLEKSNVILTFGETDCRTHLGKQVDKQKRSVADIVKECVDRYFTVVLEVKAMGFNTGVWGVIPSADPYAVPYPPDHPFPCYGTCKQRNTITRIFNYYLSELCSNNGIHFASIFEDLIHPDLTANPYFYMDQNHLSQKAFSLALSKIKVAYGID